LLSEPLRCRSTSMRTNKATTYIHVRPYVQHKPRNQTLSYTHNKAHQTRNHVTARIFLLPANTTQPH
jgi:hypothetical protein